jgi:hypothetical protein
VKVTIEFEGAPEEVEHWLRRLAGSTKSAGVVQKGASVREANGWTPELAEDLVNRISERALEALQYMAEAAPEPVSFKRLQRKLDTGGLGLGGILASFGFAERAGFPRPYEVDHDRRVYWVNPDVAQLILRAIESLDED